MAAANDVGKVLLPAATHANVMGRHLRDEANNGSVRFDWPAVRLSFLQVTGTAAVSIRMNAGRSVLGYRVVLCSSPTDSAVQQQDEVVVSDGTLSCYCHFRQRDYRLASYLDPSKRYDVQLWKQDDPGIGVVQVFGLLLDPGGSGTIRGTIIPDSPQPRRKHIEFVGNSDTVGFGNMASKSGYCFSFLFQIPAMLLGIPCVLKTTDATLSFPAFTASKLGEDIEYSIIAQSGIGAQHSEMGMSENMCSVYDRAIFRDPSSTIRSTEPDLVVVYIGNNDQSVLAEQESIFGSNRSSIESIEGMLYKSFVNLLQKIRRQHPVPEGSSDDNEKVQEEAVKIVVVVPHQDAILASMSSKRELRSTVENQRGAWTRAVEDMGGANAHIYIVQNRHEPQIKFNSRTDFGMMLHWNASSCEKWANGLAPQLEEFLSNGGR